MSSSGLKSKVHQEQFKHILINFGLDELLSRFDERSRRLAEAYQGVAVDTTVDKW
jgi:hypothetical protein